MKNIKIVHAYNSKNSNLTLCGSKGSYASNNVHCTCKRCLKLLEGGGNKMSQSTFKWIIVFDDGSTHIVESTPDQLLMNMEDIYMSNVLTIVRSDFV
jgi:hypothetical protein